MKTTNRTARRSCTPTVLAAVTGMLFVLGIRMIAKLPGDWLGWLLQCWGMA